MAAYAIEPDGSLTCRGACTAPYDAGTCFVLPDPNGRNLFGANYLSGSVACCALLDDGRLAAGVPSRRHEGRGLRDDRQAVSYTHLDGYKRQLPVQPLYPQNSITSCHILSYIVIDNHSDVWQTMTRRNRPILI